MKECLCFPQCLKRHQSPRAVAREESLTDEDLLQGSYNERLDGYKISYVLECSDGEEGGKVCLCMGLAESGVKVLPHPVASHGQGNSPQKAERMAALNLIHNISKLLPDYP